MIQKQTLLKGDSQTWRYSKLGLAGNMEKKITWSVVGERDGRQGCGRNQEKSIRKGEAELQVEEKRERNLEL